MIIYLLHIFQVQRCIVLFDYLQLLQHQFFICGLSDNVDGDNKMMGKIIKAMRHEAGFTQDDHKF